MRKTQYVQLFLALTLFVALSIFFGQVRARWSLLADMQMNDVQMNTLQDGADDGRGQEQVFLPFVVDANNDAENHVDETTPTPEPTQATDEDTIGHSHGQPIFESWPPQPIGIEEIESVPVASAETAAGAAVIAAQLGLEDAEQIALASSTVQAALGERYLHATTSRSYPKKMSNREFEPIAFRVVYFSYSHNQTVEAIVRDNAVTAVNTMAASIYQPEMTSAERQRAIDIGRTYFRDHGEPRIDELQGYVIMAYRSQGATGYYDSRVLYVTYHENLEERPEYLAWVDLSTERVLKGVADSLALHAAKYEQLGEGE